MQYVKTSRMVILSRDFQSSLFTWMLDEHLEHAWGLILKRKLESKYKWKIFLILVYFQRFRVPVEVGIFLGILPTPYLLNIDVIECFFLGSSVVLITITKSLLFMSVLDDFPFSNPNSQWSLTFDTHNEGSVEMKLQARAESRATWSVWYDVLRIGMPAVETPESTSWTTHECSKISLCCVVLCCVMLCYSYTMYRIVTAVSRYVLSYRGEMYRPAGLCMTTRINDFIGVEDLK